MQSILDLLFTQSHMSTTRFYLLIATLSALILAFAFTPVAKKVAYLVGAIDVPKDNRRMHTKPIPRFGGMAIFIAVTVSLVLVRNVFLPKLGYTGPFVTTNYAERILAIIVGGAVIYAVGVVDDITGIGAKKKLLLQIFAASVAFFIGIRMDSVFGFQLTDMGNLGMFLNYLVTILWIVLITNTINLIDGLDGLAAGVSAIAAIAIAYSAYISSMHVAALCMMTVAGAAIGFLPWNFNPAKIFMGDSGALYLGFIIASVSLIGPAKGAAIVATIMPALVLAVPLFDVVFAVFRRLVRRQHIFAPDRNHLHHQLRYMGMGQRRSVLTLYGISGIMGMAAVELSRDLVKDSIMLFAVAMLFILILVWDWEKRS
ncbi:MAG: undecaprenyl/decaprenyl-phosphate alpha-N-acetylglucosaminyl 1-phosphate transferase [Clostridiales Family XIII bacterium]|jgi:UDP-GlcNAc:undecaprenyl-phosphate GlcNAc-1-phosphate transferase|nr:undecaprenyl/decaprenyl-phosphate alpha-N-acetylglucosaminyl 1-phosphate transferase [Clostridiales Family XIII bacterium]